MMMKMRLNKIQVATLFSGWIVAEVLAYGISFKTRFFRDSFVLAFAGICWTICFFVRDKPNPNSKS
jgi:hypothetical protein